MRKLTRVLLLLSFALVVIACSHQMDKQGGTSGMAVTAEKPMMAPSNLYVQTNEADNKIIHYKIQKDGSLQRSAAYATQGRGTDGFKPATGEDSAPDPLFSAHSVQMSGNNKMLFVTNAGDNSVSCFMIQADGKPMFKDRASTGSDGTVNSLAYNDATRMLTASHNFGPNHLSQFRVGAGGDLTLMSKKYSVNTPTANDRMPTQVIHSPDGKYLIAAIIFDARPKPGENGPMLTPANVKHKDGLVTFPVNADGTLGAPIFNDAGTKTPFSLRFLNGGSPMFVCTYAAGNGAGLGRLNEDGSISTYEFKKVDLSMAPKGPSETCWVDIDAKNEYAYASNFGLGTMTSFRIDGKSLSVSEDQMAKVEGNGFKALAKIPTSGPADTWMDGMDHLYQIYGNAGVLIAFQADNGKLKEIARYDVPLNSTQGLAGF